MIVSVTRSFSESGKTRMRAKSFERKQAKNLLRLETRRVAKFPFRLDLSRKIKLYPGIAMDVGKVKFGNLGKMRP